VSAGMQAGAAATAGGWMKGFYMLASGFAPRWRKSLIALTLLFPLLGSASAEAAKSLELTADQAAAVDEVTAYINDFRTLQGDFTQVSPRGTLSKGVFFLSKPGKMRFEYADPNPLLIVSDGNWVTIKNRAKDRADQYPLSQTPLRLVLSDSIDIRREANILGVEKTPEGLTAVTLEDRKKTVPGHLILVYDSERKALQQWIVVDGQGRRTTVSLENVKAGKEPDPKLFVVQVNRSSDRKKVTR
jgi:outer membrane lipoprotein-sorting protein